jgi:hypothetical protein
VITMVRDIGAMRQRVKMRELHCGQMHVCTTAISHSHENDRELRSTARFPNISINLA